MGKTAFVFPGQGAAAVGMGREIVAASPAAAAVWAEAAAGLPQLPRLCFEGPLDELVQTANAQPAIFAVDCACLAALAAEGIQPDVVAGHSLGEYAALVAAGVLEPDATLVLVRARAEAMQAACAQPGTMAAVTGTVYPGGGIPIGASMLFSHLAALDMATRISIGGTDYGISRSIRRPSHPDHRRWFRYRAGHRAADTR